MPYLWDKDIWTDFASIMEFLLWAAIEKEEMEVKGENTACFVLQIAEEMENAEKVIKRRMELSKISGIKLHTVKFFSVMQLSSIERFAVILSAAAGASYKLNSVLTAAESRKNVNSPTVEMVLRLYGVLNEPDLKEVAVLINMGGDLELCFEKDGLNRNKTRICESMRIKNSLLSYLLGQDFDIDYKQVVIKKPLPKLLIYDNVLEMAVNAAENQKLTKEKLTVYIYGKKKSGKKLLVSYMAECIGRQAVFIFWNDIADMPYENKEKLFYDINLKTRLEDSFICLYGIPDFSEERNLAEKTVLRRIIEISPFTVVLGEGKYDFPAWTAENFMSLELWELSATEKISVWSYYSGLYNAAHKIDSELNGNKYVMSVGEIENTFATARNISVSKNFKDISAEDIAESIKQRGQGKLGSYASLIEGNFVWDDLIVDDAVKRQMRYICGQIKYRNIVGEEWGFFEKTPYGRGVSVLFYGPPGTGKTMAVQIMASELGLELYRVDLSKMVSKYIGETEKNISALFDRAKRMNVILFFDEADSLFAKRSEVKDSNDRNANAETAHLLQKMEEYDGMVILATNLVEQIDDAFRRRIKFMVQFRFPDFETRRHLWYSLIPDKTPLEDGIDLDFFAKQFELSGSQIKEILWNAAYISVCDQKKLGNEQIKEAIAWNYMKYGKQLTKDDFGYLA